MKRNLRGEFISCNIDRLQRQLKLERKRRKKVEAALKEKQMSEPKFQVVNGWSESQELIEESIKPPMRFYDDLGRIFELVSWEPRVTVDALVTVKIEAVVKVPEKEQCDKSSS